MRTFKTMLLAVIAVALFQATASALETPIGVPQSLYGMEIAAVYLQAIEMDPKGIMKPRAESDIHLECDIHAAENNPNGFAAGEWMPNLVIWYTIVKMDTKQKIEGQMMPMVANDGPHYGDNVKMMGAGRYKVVYRITSPREKGEFGRHTDRETGVRDWFKPFEIEWEFDYFGAGKKGGY
ncbi:MAG: iron transporter [Deltaproteobacteria bacterium]|nr:iron transporter [Deltaproteobacteria bacterium]